MNNLYQLIRHHWRPLSLPLYETENDVRSEGVIKPNKTIQLELLDFVLMIHRKDYGNPSEQSCYMVTRKGAGWTFCFKQDFVKVIPKE